MSTRSEAFLSDAQARDNVTDAELALDKDGTFLGFRVSSTVNAGAYLQSGFQAYTGNLGTLAGVYRTPAMYVESTAVFTHTHPCRPYRGNGRPEAAYVIERMVDLAAAELKMDPAELRRKNYIPPEAMPFKTSLTFTYDCGEFEKGMDLALKLADVAGFDKRKAESKKQRQAARARHVQHHRARRGGEPRRRRNPLRPRRHGARSSPAASTRARATRPRSSRWWPTSSASIPNDIEYIQGDTDKVFFGEGTGGSRSATMSGSAFHNAAEKVIDKAKAIAAHNLKVDVGRRQFRRGHLLQRQDQPDHDHQGRGAERGRTRRSCRRTWRPACSRPRSTRPTSRTSRTACTSARSRSIRRPARSRSCATTWSTTSAP